MFLMIDNYDSFVYNLKAYFEELGREIMATAAAFLMRPAAAGCGSTPAAALPS